MRGRVPFGSGGERQAGVRVGYSMDMGSTRVSRAMYRTYGNIRQFPRISVHRIVPYQPGWRRITLNGARMVSYIPV